MAMAMGGKLMFGAAEAGAAASIKMARARANIAAPKRHGAQCGSCSADSRVCPLHDGDVAPRLAGRVRDRAIVGKGAPGGEYLRYGLE